MNTLYFFLVTIIIFGIITSYTDIKTYFIKNKHLKYFIITATILHIIYFYQLSQNPNFLAKQYLINTTLNTILCLIIGFFLWKQKNWAAADAKLFTSFVFASPMLIYQHNTIQYFPGISILIHSFILILILTTYQIIKKINKQKLIKAMLEIKEKPHLLYNKLIMVIAIEWLFAMITIIFEIEYKTIYSIILILLFKPIKDIIQKIPQKKHIIIPLIIIRIIFDENLLTISYILRIITLMLILLVLNFFLFELPDEIFRKKTKIKQLKKGMILANPIYQIEKTINKKTKITCKQIRDINKNKYQELTKNKQITLIISNVSQGLQNKDIKNLNKMLQNKQIKNEINIVEHTYFAPYLFIGTLITWATKGNLFYYIQHLISNYF